MLLWNIINHIHMQHKRQYPGWKSYVCLINESRQICYVVCSVHLSSTFNSSAISKNKRHKDSADRLHFSISHHWKVNIFRLRIVCRTKRDFGKIDVGLIFNLNISWLHQVAVRSLESPVFTQLSVIHHTLRRTPSCNRPTASVWLHWCVLSGCGMCRCC